MLTIMDGPLSFSVLLNVHVQLPIHEHKANYHPLKHEKYGCMHTSVERITNE